MLALSFVLLGANLPFTIVGAVAVLVATFASIGIFDHDHDLDAAEAGDLFWNAFGIGRLPLSLGALAFGLTFSLSGLLVNVAWLPDKVPLVSLVWSLPIATAAGVGVVALLSRALTPLLSTRSCEATRRVDLVGLTGVVISSEVTPEFGEVRVRDRLGHELRLVCRLAEGHGAVREGEAVVFMAVDDAGALTVAPESSLLTIERKEGDAHL